MRAAIREARLALLLLLAVVRPAAGQALSLDTAWRAWAFLRGGVTMIAPDTVVSGGAHAYSASVGVAASYHMLVGMARLSGSEQFVYAPDVTDAALLAGLRSRGNRFFVTGAAGIARAKVSNTVANISPITGAALAYDLAAHAAAHTAGLGLAISGVVGPPKTSYLSVTLGVELGWFGR